MVSLTWWSWVWVNSGSWWWTGRWCCDSWGRKELDTTERLIWSEGSKPVSNKNSENQLDRKATKAALPWVMLEGQSHSRPAACTITLQAPLSMGFSRREYSSGLPCPPPGDLPNLGIKPRSSALQVDSLPSEPLRKPKSTGVSSLSLHQRILQADSLPAELPGKPTVNRKHCFSHSCCLCKMP